MMSNRVLYYDYAMIPAGITEDEANEFMITMMFLCALDSLDMVSVGHYGGGLPHNEIRVWVDYVEYWEHIDEWVERFR